MPLWGGVAAPLQAMASAARDHLARARADEALVDAVVAQAAAQGQSRVAASTGGPVDGVVAAPAAVAGLQVVRVEAAEGGSLVTVTTEVTGPGADGVGAKVTADAPPALAALVAQAEAEPEPVPVIP